LTGYGAVIILNINGAI